MLIFTPNEKCLFKAMLINFVFVNIFLAVYTRNSDWGFIFLYHFQTSLIALISVYGMGIFYRYFSSTLLRFFITLFLSWFILYLSILFMMFQESLLPVISRFSVSWLLATFGTVYFWSAFSILNFILLSSIRTDKINPLVTPFHSRIRL